MNRIAESSLAFLQGAVFNRAVDRHSVEFVTFAISGSILWQTSGWGSGLTVRRARPRVTAVP